MSKNFIDLPDVLIQDSKTATSYFISSEELWNFKTEVEKELDNTVTFLVHNDLLDEVNNSISNFENPSILIKNSQEDSTYNFFISSEELKEFKITKFEQMTEITDNCLAFILPTGDELLEDIPNMSPAMLQSGTKPTEFAAPLKKQA